MTDLKIDKDLGAKILGATSILALVAGIVFLFWPKPSSAAATKANDKQIASYMEKAQAAQAATALFDKGNRAHIWAGPQAEIAPSALALTTSLAKSHRLKLATFRPQKSVELKGVSELPFLLALEGSYPDIAAFLREIEKPDSKLVPEMLQLSAGDQATDKVTASITVAAFAVPPPAVPAGTKTAVKPSTKPAVKPGAKAESTAKGGSDGRAL